MVCLCFCLGSGVGPFQWESWSEIDMVSGSLGALDLVGPQDSVEARLMELTLAATVGPKSVLDFPERGGLRWPPGSPAGAFLHLEPGRRRPLAACMPAADRARRHR